MYGHCWYVIYVLQYSVLQVHMLSTCTRLMDSSNRTITVGYFRTCRVPLTDSTDRRSLPIERLSSVMLILRSSTRMMEIRVFTVIAVI